jgi:hypothetical protein
MLKCRALYKVTLKCAETRYPVAGIMQAKYLVARSKTVPPLIAQPTGIGPERIRTMTALSRVIS